MNKTEKVLLFMRRKTRSRRSAQQVRGGSKSGENGWQDGTDGERPGE